MINEKLLAEEKESLSVSITGTRAGKDVLYQYMESEETETG